MPDQLPMQAPTFRELVDQGVAMEIERVVAGACSTLGSKGVAISAELWDDDGRVVAIRTEATTRGQARAHFAREWDIDFPRVKLHREWFYDSPEYRAEQEADGIEEPYDGYLLTRCGPATPGAVEFWILAKECRR